MKNTKNSLLAAAAALLILGCWTSSAQTTGAFRFRNLSIEEGLSQSDVTDIIQDGTGFMWFATNNGLNRYDGPRIVTYKSIGTGGDGLSGNIVFCLERDSLGNFWVGTRNGIDYYDRDAESFASYHALLMPSGAELPILRARRPCCSGPTARCGPGSATTSAGSTPRPDASGRSTSDRHFPTRAEA